MNNQQEKTVNRNIAPQWDKFIAIASTLCYGRIEQIEFRDKRPKFVRLVYDLNFEDLDDLRKKFDELRTIPMID